MPSWIPAGGGSAAQKIDIQTFTSDGTWTKPANALWCQILIVDGGTGGNGGGYNAGSLAGAGGAGGDAILYTVSACMIPDTAAVVIAAGGTGGAGAVGDAPGNGNAPASLSSFDVFKTTIISTNYTTIVTFDTYGLIKSVGSEGGAGGDIDGEGNTGLGTYTPFDDGDLIFNYSNGGAGGAVSANGATGGSFLFPGGAGGGGGGGAVTATSAGGNGGAGGAYGGGGGGGGSGDGTFSGGNGGAGADGVVIVWTVCNG